MLRSRKCAALASAFVVAALAVPAATRADRESLPVYVEDNHAGSLEFLAGILDPARPCTLVLVDAHSDASAPAKLAELQDGLWRVGSAQERVERIREWRRTGAVQAFDWIPPLVPSPISRVLWVRPASAPPGLAALPPGFLATDLVAFPRLLGDDERVVVTIDLDTFAGLGEVAAAEAFRATWSRIVTLPRLAAITFAVSRPWLGSDEEASGLLGLALGAVLALPQVAIRFEPFGVEGPDRSERAKEYYREGREPPRFDVETSSRRLRALFVANADRFDVRLDPARWETLLGRWRLEQGNWRVAVDGLQPGADGVVRLPDSAVTELTVIGGPPGHIRRVRWLRWTPRAWAYNVLPELPAGKVFAGVAPPLVEYERSVLADTNEPTLGADVWLASLPGPEHTGVLRVSAELETDAGPAETARLEIRRGLGNSFRRGISEQFGLPYVFGAGFLRVRGLTGPETGAGNDCANFLVAAWRRSGLRMPWSNPAQLRRHLQPVAMGITVDAGQPIPGDAAERGLVIHLGSHVAALWEDRPPVGRLGPEDLVVHHLGGAPEVISLGQLLSSRERKTFDLYLGPSREPKAWLAVGGDIMPGSTGEAPRTVREAFRGADLGIANLETVVGHSGLPQLKRYTFQVPPGRLDAIRAIGIRGLSVANNHGGDFGPEGLDATLRSLDAAGIGHFGGGVSTSAAVSAWHTTLKGIPVAVIAVSLTDPELLPAGAHRPGLAVLPSHAREVADAIAAAHERARTVVILVHWGAEGTATVSDEQRTWARWLVRHGADAVVGSGPHMIQPEDVIDGVPVYYSLGNLWFDGRWPIEAQRASVALLGLDASGRIVVATSRPIEPP